MKKSITTLLVLLLSALFTGMAVSEVRFLRGDQALDQNAAASEKRKQEIVKGSFERSYSIQPPMIPHKIDKDQINLKVNTCMNCHSEKTFQEKKAPKAGDSHYVDRDGVLQKTLSSRRYFCNQCHALQVDAEPLVENTFVGAK